jgi:hypothetical protein
MPIVSSYTVARRWHPNHLGCVRPTGRFGARQAQNSPKTPPERPKKCIVGGEPREPAQRGAPVWFDHEDTCGPPGSDGTLSVGASRVGHCLPVVLGRLHLDSGAKMENAPNPKQAAKHQLGGRPVALTGPTRGATSRSLTREWRVIRATQLY